MNAIILDLEQEGAWHVFIKNGLSLFENKSVSILEIGFLGQA
jgi:hypothetical protein